MQLPPPRPFSPPLHLNACVQASHVFHSFLTCSIILKALVTCAEGTCDRSVSIYYTCLYVACDVVNAILDEMPHKLCVE